MTDITIEELDTALHSVSNNKAAGKNGIPYEFWKNATESTKYLLINMMNKCINDEEMVEDWRKSLIYPISKPYDWNKNLNLTRPITLIDIARKLMTKILTK
jgi:hypothetical protein